MKTPLREQGSLNANLIRLGVRIFFVLSLLAFPSGAPASPLDESATVYLLLPDAPPAPLDEAVFRISAELRAVGFEIERRSLNSQELVPSAGASEAIEESPREPPVFVAPRIELDPQSDRLEIRAYSEPQATPLVQTMRWEDDESAEVIAIRAVELLRAAMLQSLRDERTRASPSSVVVRFTGHHQAEAPPAPQVVEPTSVHPSEQSTSLHTKRKRPSRWMLAAGAGIYGEGSSTTPRPSAEFLGTLMFGVFFVGASLDGSILPLSWTLSEGSLDVRQLSLHWRGGLRAPCPSRFECHLGGAVGYHGLFLQPKPSTGQNPDPVRHSGLLLSGDVLIARFWDNGWGLFGHTRVGSMLNAPSAEDEPSAGPLGRPSYNVAIGLAFRSDL